MAKQLNDIPNPFAYRDELKKMEKLKAKEQTLQEKIQAVVEGEKPKDVMSWEFYIWNQYNNPMQRLKR
jgi:hypothetical protein